MKKEIILSLIVLAFFACAKNHPTGYRLKPPGERYISSYQTMQLVGNFQNWNLDDPNSYMELMSDYIWEKDENIGQSGLIQFKFVPNHNWEPSFGTTGSDTGLSGYAEVVSGLGTEIALNLPERGIWRFHFNEKTRFFKLTKKEGFTGAIVGKIVFMGTSIPPYPKAIIKLCDTLYHILSTTSSDSLTGNFGFYALQPNRYIILITATSYLPETLLTTVREDTVNLGEIVLVSSEIRQPPTIDGLNDFLPTDLIGIDPTGDMTERNLDLDSLWGVIVGETLYIGFNAYCELGYELSYGIYLSLDTTRSSGATRDPWNRNVRASFGMPEFALYIWHNNRDSLSVAQLCEWNGMWNYYQINSIGGAQAYRNDNHFIELMIPLVALRSPDSIFVELFTTGGENSHAQDTSPQDPNVTFTTPNWSASTTTTLSSFAIIRR